MAEQGDLQAPAWLQRNWTPKEPFDPTPWLQERYRRQVEQAKLPLELQRMELGNKAANLAIEHQGLINDQMNQELDMYAAEQPALKDWLAQNAKTPGIAPPQVRSKQGVSTVLAQQKLFADSEYGKAIAQVRIQQTKQAAEIAEYLGIEVPMDPNGRFDQAMLTDLAQQANEVKTQRELEKQAAATGWHEKLAVMNQAGMNARAADNLAIRKDAAADRKVMNQGMLALRQNAQEIQIEKLLQSDVEAKALREQRDEIFDDVGKAKRAAEKGAGWIWGLSQKELDAEVVTKEKALKDLEKQIARREDALRKRFKTEVLDETAAPAPEQGAPPAEFFYDPESRTLVAPE